MAYRIKITMDNPLVKSMDGLPVCRWGAKYVCGTVILFMGGVWVQKFYFKSKDERQKIFKLWNEKYKLEDISDWFIDIKYSLTTKMQNHDSPIH